MRAIALTVTPVRVSVFRNPVSDATSTPPRNSSLCPGLAPDYPTPPPPPPRSPPWTPQKQKRPGDNIVDRASWPARGVVSAPEMTRPALQRRHHGRSIFGISSGLFLPHPLGVVNQESHECPRKSPRSHGTAVGRTACLAVVDAFKRAVWNSLNARQSTLNTVMPEWKRNRATAAAAARASHAGSAGGICQNLATGWRAGGRGWHSTRFWLHLPKQRGVVGPALKNLLRPRAPGSPRVAGDQVSDAPLLGGITKSRPAHVLWVAPDRQDVRLVQHIRDTACHASSKVPPDRPQHHDDAACHVLTPVITHTLYDRRGAAVAHAEALSRSPRCKQIPAGGAIQCGVPENHVVLRGTCKCFGRPDDNLSPGHALADIVVGLPL